MWLVRQEGLTLFDGLDHPQHRDEHSLLPLTANTDLQRKCLPMSMLRANCSVVPPRACSNIGLRAWPSGVPRKSVGMSMIYDGMPTP